MFGENAGYGDYGFEPQHLMGFEDYYGTQYPPSGSNPGGTSISRRGALNKRGNIVELPAYQAPPPRSFQRQMGGNREDFTHQASQADLRLATRATAKQSPFVPPRENPPR